MKSSKAVAVALLLFLSLPGSTSSVAAGQPAFVTLRPGQVQQIADLGDESSTVMSYTHLNLDFSQHQSIKCNSGKDHG